MKKEMYDALTAKIFKSQETGDFVTMDIISPSLAHSIADIAYNLERLVDLMEAKEGKYESKNEFD